MRRFLVWTLGLFAALFVVLLLVLIFPPTGWIAGKIEEMVGARTGYALDIGNLDLDLLSAVPSATLSSVSVEGGQLPGLLEAGRAEVAIDPGAALGGEIVIDRVVVADAEVRLLRTADGRTSWTPGAVQAVEATSEPDGGEFDVPTIRELRIEDLDIVVDDEITGTEAVLAVQASGSTLPGETPLSVAIQGQANGAPVQAGLELESPLGDAASGGPVRLALDASTDGASIALAGRIAEPATLGGVDLALEADIDQLDALETVLGTELPALAPANLVATFTSEGDGHALAADGTVDGEPVTASLQLDASFEQLRAGGPVALDPDASIADVLAGEPVQLDLDASVGGASVRASGRIDDIRTLEGSDLDLDVNIDSFATLERLTGVTLPDLAPASLTTTLNTEGGRTVLEADGTVGGEPARATLALDVPIADALAGEAVGIDLEGSVGGAELVLSGRVDDPRTLGGLDLEFGADVESFDAIETLLGTELPDLAPVALNGTLLGEGDAFVVRRFDLAAVESTLQGDVRVDPTTEPPTVYANLISRRLDADALLAAFGIETPDEAVVPDAVLEEEAGQGETEGPVLSPELLPIDAVFATVRGAVALRVQELLYAAVPLNSFDVRAELAPELVTIELGEAVLADGEVSGTLELEPIRGQSSLDGQLDLELSRVRVARFVPDVELLDDLGGPLGGQVKLWAAGNSVATLAGSLDGGVTLLMGRGELDALLVELAGLDLFQSIGDLLNPGDEAFSLRCAYVSLLADTGLVSLEEFVIDSTDTVLLGRGTVGLGAETFDLVLESLPKDPSLLSANTGVSIGGTFVSPEIEIGSELPVRAAAAGALALAAGPAAALLPFIEIGGGEDSGFCELEGALDGDAG